MMQKFLVAPEHVYDSPDPDDRRKLTEYYLASEVDAERSELIAHNVEAHARIAELEKALRFYAEAKSFYCWDKDGDYHDCGNKIAINALMVSKL